jgi:dolichyl-phosphate-mannose--protein O-mannosyl transferase
MMGSWIRVLVTAISSTTTTNTLWWIRGPNDEERHGREAACTSGVAEPIKCGSIIRLLHLDSLRNLHSHNVRSPISRQQEVSCFGKGDNGNDWKVVCCGDYWERFQPVAFQHVDSGKFLGASSTVKFTHQNCGHNCPILNHLEVFGRSQKDNFGMWVVEMGVHLSK